MCSCTAVRPCILHAIGVTRASVLSEPEFDSRMGHHVMGHVLRVFVDRRIMGCTGKPYRFCLPASDTIENETHQHLLIEFNVRTIYQAWDLEQCMRRGSQGRRVELDVLSMIFRSHSTGVKGTLAQSPRKLDRSECETTGVRVVVRAGGCGPLYQSAPQHQPPPASFPILWLFESQ